MPTPIKYRITSTPEVPTSTTVKGTPLTSAEIDGNFKSMVDSVDAKVDSTDLAAPSGAALVGADTGLTYAAGTVGALLKSLQGQIAGILDGATFTGPVSLPGNAVDNLHAVPLVQAMQIAADAVSDRFFTSGEALPTSNVGPIWHDDYNSLMTWQSFTANGASYTGYASQFVGRIEMDTQPTARTGYKRVGSETLALSRSQFAALRAWGLHNGRFVAVGVWQAGTLLMADNADGVTFRAFDVRGEFPRFWDDGLGVDAGRLLGTWQDSENKSHNHPLDDRIVTEAVPGVSYGGTTSGASGNIPTTELSGGIEARPRNTAFSAMLKF